MKQKIKKQPNNYHENGICNEIGKHHEHHAAEQRNDRVLLFPIHEITKPDGAEEHGYKKQGRIQCPLSDRLVITASASFKNHRGLPSRSTRAIASHAHEASEVAEKVCFDGIIRGNACEPFDKEPMQSHNFITDFGFDGRCHEFRPESTLRFRTCQDAVRCNIPSVGAMVNSYQFPAFVD